MDIKKVVLKNKEDKEIYPISQAEFIKTKDNSNVQLKLDKLNIDESKLPQGFKNKDLGEILSLNFTNVSNGKDSLYSAVIDKGVTPKSKDFKDLTQSIKDIKTAKGNANPGQVLKGATFTNANGTIQEGTIPIMGSKEIMPKTHVQELKKGYYEGIKVNAISNLTTIADELNEKNELFKQYTESTHIEKGLTHYINVNFLPILISVCRKGKTARRKYIGADFIANKTINNLFGLKFDNTAHIEPDCSSSASISEHTTCFDFSIQKDNKYSYIVKVEAKGYIDEHDCDIWILGI